MNLLEKLTADEQALANRLDPRELAFANLWLCREDADMSAAECYLAAGFPSKSRRVAFAFASQKLKVPAIARYIRERLKRDDEAQLSTDFLDDQLKQIIDSTAPDVVSSYAVATGAIDAETGEPVVIHSPVLRCAIDELPPAVQASIQSFKVTQGGSIEVKLYDRVAALKLAYQRKGALTMRSELTGKGGGPVQVKSDLSDAEINSKIMKLLNSDDSDTPADPATP